VDDAGQETEGSPRMTAAGHPWNGAARRPCAGCAQRQQAARAGDDHVLAAMTVAFVAVILASWALFRVRGLSRVISAQPAGWAS